MVAFAQKFIALFTHKEESYVPAMIILDEYKAIIGQMRKQREYSGLTPGKPTQATMIRDLKLSYVAVVRMSRDKTLIGTIAKVDVLAPTFKSWRSINIHVNTRELQHHKLLMARIEALPDIDVGLPADEEPEEVAAGDAFPLLQLQDHEKFRDAATGDIVEIETRGERSKEGILFKAVDVAEYYEMPRLVEIILNDRTSQYEHERDYMIQGLLDHSNPVIEESNQPEKKRKYIVHNRVYLTLAGLLRVAMVSHSKNANLMKTVDWMIEIFYTHQFGSQEERQSLSKDLLKMILNDDMPGLYFMHLGTFNDLYDSMNISRETYPPDTYGTHTVGKFGLTKNISTRSAQHKNKKNGYGQWSDNIDLKWLILLPPSQLPSAEKLLSRLLGADGYTFPHIDESDKKHVELIMFPAKKELHVKKIYKQVLSLYPSKENELAQAIEDNRTQFEHELLRRDYDHMVELTEKDVAIRDEREKATAAQHKVDMLELRLEMAKM